VADDPLESWTVEDIENCELVLSFAATALAKITGSVLGQIGFGIAGQESVVLAQRGHAEFVAAIYRKLSVATLTPRPETRQVILQTSASVSPGTPCFVISTRPLSVEAVQEMLGEDGWRTAGPWVRWVDCRSEEFRRTFQLCDNSDSMLQQLRNEMAIREPSDVSA